MKISVVISVYNEQEMLPDCLDSLQLQTRSADEVIVVDNNSTDTSVAIARQFGVKVVREKKQGIWAARHTGYDAAQGDIIVCTDADARFPKDWLKNIEKGFAKNKVIAVVGPGEFYDSSAPINKVANWLYMKPYFFLTQLALTTKPLFGSNFALRKSVWNKVRNDVHSGREDIFDDLDLTHHIIPYGKILYSEQCKNYISIRPLKSPLGMLCRYEKGLRSMYIHWPSQSPRKLWQKRLGL
jgi:glycosyltransferase involved in cell wall biosynthesis